jgi:hypothetical protein
MKGRKLDVRDIYNLEIARVLTHEVSIENEPVNPKLDELCVRVIAIIQLCEQQAATIKSLSKRALQERA